MKISIVIRSHNEEEHIGRLLSGIAEQTITDLDIILVDSGSTDATVTIASRYPVRILTIPKEDFSFGRSLNIGCNSTNWDLIVLASAHVYPMYKDWLENLVKRVTAAETSDAQPACKCSALTQKVTFWLIVFLALPLILSIILSMFPLFGTYWQEYLLALHRYTAIVFFVVVIVHTLSLLLGGSKK